MKKFQIINKQLKLLNIKIQDSTAKYIFLNSKDRYGTVLEAHDQLASFSGLRNAMRNPRSVPSANRFINPIAFNVFL